MPIIKLLLTYGLPDDIRDVLRAVGVRCHDDETRRAMRQRALDLLAAGTIKKKDILAVIPGPVNVQFYLLRHNARDLRGRPISLRYMADTCSVCISTIQNWIAGDRKANPNALKVLKQKIRRDGAIQCPGDLLLS